MVRNRRVAALAALAALLGASASLAASGRKLAPLRAGQQPQPSLFGINTGTYDSSESRLSHDLPTAVRLGGRWVHFTGDSIKYDSRGRVSFALMDREVNSACGLGLGVVMSLGGIRQACSIKPAPSDPTRCPPTTPHDLAVYYRYLRVLLHHFAGRVRYFESWVEPNHSSMWGGAPSAAQYTALLLDEYRAFRASEPNDRLMFAGVADFGITDGSPSGEAVLPFTDQVLSDLQGRRAFDLVALHAYRFPPSLAPDDLGWTHYASGPLWRKDTWAQQLEAYEAEFTSHGYGQPAMWLTEFGWPGNTRAAGNYFPSLSAQATDVAQAYEALEGPQLRFVKAAFWFNQRDYQPGLANPDPGFFAHYGLLYNNYAAKPAAAVFERYSGAG
ncbi:MAG TPA: hypothetical protein VHX66_04520 [Solirubrobacteraceae bacterium]|jgi:hypothetical protein|nr:hypothetical protein [Solirubrobacteraceae bacterium]